LVKSQSRLKIHWKRRQVDIPTISETRSQAMVGGSGGSRHSAKGGSIKFHSISRLLLHWGAKVYSQS